MEWYWIVLIVIGGSAVAGGIATALAYLFGKKKKTKLARTRDGAIMDIEEVPLEEIDETRLCEIDDAGVSERVKSLMPDLIKTEISAGLMVTTASKTVYKIILPASTKLAAASSAGGLLSGAGLSMAAGQVGALISSSVTAVMSAAAMVVGQYYMTQVNIELKRIGESISRLGQFQDNEFRSKVFALSTQVSRSSMFRAEIMGNTRLREAEIAKLDALEHECAELLGHAALMIGDLTQKTDLDYNRYIKAVADIQQWFVCQRILFDTLCEIADLKFALHLGAASREQCRALLPVYAHQIEETQQMLRGWHKFTTEKLGIKLDEFRRKRKGVDKVVHWLPGLFKKDMKYRAVPESTVAIIEHQIAGKPVVGGEQSNLFAEDVELIAKDGKLYYLPKEPLNRVPPAEEPPAPYEADEADEADGELPAEEAAEGEIAAEGPPSDKPGS